MTDTSDGPRYLVAYSWTAGGEHGTGCFSGFRPTVGGKPSVLTPAHIVALRDKAAASVHAEYGHTNPNIVITCVWRFEDQ